MTYKAMPQRGSYPKKFLNFLWWNNWLIIINFPVSGYKIYAVNGPVTKKKRTFIKKNFMNTGNENVTCYSYSIIEGHSKSFRFLSSMKTLELNMCSIDMRRVFLLEMDSIYFIEDINKLFNEVSTDLDVVSSSRSIFVVLKNNLVNLQD